MKYIALILFDIAVLLPYLIVERTARILSVFFKILWHFRIKEKWLKEYFDGSIVVFLPLPVIPLCWIVKTYKEYFLLRWGNTKSTLI